MFAIIIIIIVTITGKSHTRTWPWLQDDASQFYILCLSQNRVEENIPWRKAFIHASGLRCSMAFFWLFPFDRRFPHCRQQSSPMIILWEKLWQCDRIIYHRFKRVISPEGLSVVFFGQIAVSFKLSTMFLKNTSKLQLRNVHFPQQQNILDFFIVSDFSCVCISEIVPIILDYGIKSSLYDRKFKISF